MSVPCDEFGILIFSEFKITDCIISHWLIFQITIIHIHKSPLKTQHQFFSNQLYFTLYHKFCFISSIFIVWKSFCGWGIDLKYTRNVKLAKRFLKKFTPWSQDNIWACVVSKCEVIAGTGNQVLPKCYLQCCITIKKSWNVYNFVDDMCSFFKIENMSQKKKI